MHTCLIVVLVASISTSQAFCASVRSIPRSSLRMGLYDTPLPPRDPPPPEDDDDYIPNDEKVALPEVTGIDWDGEFAELMNSKQLGKLDKDGVADQKLEIEKEQNKRNIRDAFQPDTSQDWLPGKKNPRPISDEPWFTG